MMSDKTLTIKLNDIIVGYLTHHQDGKNIFVFDESYIESAETMRPVLSQSFVDFNKVYVTRYRLPTFFSNLLPEGEMRTFIAAQLGLHVDDEFSLLAALGHDLPGAVIAEESENKNVNIAGDHVDNQNTAFEDDALHFSLAGVQIKFSMLQDKSWFTFAKNNMPGDYIVKTPSVLYPHVPENEFSMMTLATEIGMQVPEVQLIKLQKLKNLPAINLPDEDYAYAVKRFDRSGATRIHIEDFAQVFDAKPQQKYQASNYDTMARVLNEGFAESDQQVSEFLRRLFFNILIGNTDAHLKNWSLIYRDPMVASLSPAYDLVSTLPYLNNRRLALNFAKQKQFYEIDKALLSYFAKRTGLSEKKVLTIAKDTVARFKSAWQAISPNLPLQQRQRNALREHWKLLPLYQL